MLYRDAQHRRSESCSDSNASAWSILGNGTFGDVNMEIDVLKKSLRYLEDLGFGFEVGESCLGGFLHNIANLAGNL